jgi:hypothetical protein
MQDHCVTIRELAEEVGISTGSVHSILTNDLASRRMSAKFMPKLIQTFLAKHNIPVVRQAPYSPDIAPCDYLLFPTWKRSWKGLDLSHETTLYGTCRPSSTPFAKRHTRNASNNGGTTGRSVFSHEETTSEGIRVAEVQACKCIFPGQRSDTFWTAHVYLHPCIC